MTAFSPETTRPPSSALPHLLSLILLPSLSLSLLYLSLYALASPPLIFRLYQTPSRYALAAALAYVSISL